MRIKSKLDRLESLRRRRTNQITSPYLLRLVAELDLEAATGQAQNEGTYLHDYNKPQLAGDIPKTIEEVLEGKKRT